ncbi:MAG: rhodanese-like domain-containing protein [Halobacteria archaeon]|nr:rhodanese-like domain-containing protein [Halobacteria archaeon]
MVDEVTPDEVKDKLNNGDEESDCQIIDIRNPLQFSQGHIPGAENIPMNELPEVIGEHDWGDDIVVVCPVGQSSVQAARLIKSYEGIGDADVASMEGGYEEWEYELADGTEDE